MTRKELIISIAVMEFLKESNQLVLRMDVFEAERKMDLYRIEDFGDFCKRIRTSLKKSFGVEKVMVMVI